MRKALFVCVALLTFHAMSRAEDLWKAKPIREWTREETQQFFRDSPWVRQVTVSGGSSADALTAARGPTSAIGRGPTSGSCCPQISGDIPGAWDASSDASLGGWSSRVFFYVQWTSARTVRQAVSHLRALDGLGQEQTDVTPLPNYVVTVAGADLRAFDGVSETEPEISAHLRAKRAKTKVDPVNITIKRQQDGRTTSVHFEFPREVRGQPFISRREKSVEFYCKVKDLTLRTNFNLSKMVTAQGRDL